jgi:selenocysteine lyase/cysteine desulfurase
MCSLVYLNHAATSYPKPPEVVAAVRAALDLPPGDESRGGRGTDPRAPCRAAVAELVAAPSSSHVALLPSATHALNLVIAGLTEDGGRVVTTVLEHNSVLRPLAHRHRDRGATLCFVAPEHDGRLEASRMRDALAVPTALIAMTHVSNVSGAVQPVEAVAEIAAAAGVPLLVDASQSIGCVDIRHADLPGRVFLAFAGHKNLLGPPGVGCLVVPDDTLAQSIVGGSGIRSESPLHPEELPLRHEAGTPNSPGIAGLLAGVRAVAGRGVQAEGEHRSQLVAFVRHRLAATPKVRLLPLAGDDRRAGIVSFTLDGWDSESLSYTLRESFAIETRGGLHCAPRAHEFFGCGRAGAVRASFGVSSTTLDAEALVDSISRVAGG